MPKLTVAQIVAERGTPKRTIIAAINRGDLKATKLPGRTGAYLIEQRDLDRWAAKREAKASAGASA